MSDMVTPPPERRCHGKCGQGKLFCMEVMGGRRNSERKKAIVFETGLEGYPVM